MREKGAQFACCNPTAIDDDIWSKPELSCRKNVSFDGGDGVNKRGRTGEYSKVPMNEKM